MQNITETDRQHLWHPYTSTSNPLPVYPVSKAYGCTIELMDGQNLVDGMSSWWAAIHGYNHPVLNKAAHNQIEAMSHIMFGGLTHQPAADLCEQLLEILPQGIDKIFYADSGSVSVEIAMKMALQYWQAKGISNKHTFASLEKGYHGDTWNAMSVCDPDTGMHHIFKGRLPISQFASQPTSRFGEALNETDKKQIRLFFENHAENMAAFILEPIVQGAGGMWFYSEEYLRYLRQACDEFEVLLIADEIATGFGRTGKLFACEHSNISPDIICMGKAITGGYMTFAATATTTPIAGTICSGEAGVFMHGPTFMGNPLACAVASANLKLLKSWDWQTKISQIESQLNEELSVCRNYKSVKEVRVLGGIGVCELHNAVDMAKIQKQFVDLGVWIRPFGRLVYLMPPFIITEQELTKLTDAVKTVLRSNQNN